MLLPERFTKRRQVLPVHAVQHYVQHLLHCPSRSWPGDVAVAELRAARRGATMKSGGTPLLVPALLSLPGLFLFTCSSCQILFMLPLQPLTQLLVALLLLLSLPFAFPSFRSRGRRRQSLSVGVLFIEIFFPDTISPVPKVFIVVIDRKIIVRCDTNTLLRGYFRVKRS